MIYVEYHEGRESKESGSGFSVEGKIGGQFGTDMKWGIILTGFKLVKIKIKSGHEGFGRHCFH